MNKTHGPLRTGVAGLSHGAGHASRMADHDGFDVVALCDTDADRVKAVSGRLGLDDAASYDDFERMLDEASLDAVVIATPTRLHTDMAVAALERNVHVLLEKAPAETLEGCRRIADAAAGSEAICQVAFEFRSAPLFNKVGEIIRSGELGETVFLWVNQFRGSPRTAWRMDRTIGGAFFDCCIHQVDILLTWMGCDFRRAQAMGARAGECGPTDDVPDTVAASIEFGNGVRANVSFSQVTRVRKISESHFGVVGTSGRIDGNPWDPEHAGSLEVVTDGGLFRERIVVSGDMTSTGHLGFAEQHDAFLAAARGEGENVCDIESATRTQRLMAAFDLSLREGRIVSRDEFE